MLPIALRYNFQSDYLVTVRDDNAEVIITMMAARAIKENIAYSKKFGLLAMFTIGQYHLG